VAIHHSAVRLGIDIDRGEHFDGADLRQRCVIADLHDPALQ
jgi:hypothetical protein